MRVNEPPPVWQDGHAAQRPELHPHDRGLLYGWGAFTTTRTHAGVPWQWDAHCARLRRTLALFADAAVALPTADDVRGFVGGEDAVVRLNASAGRVGGRPAVWLIRRPLPPRAHACRLAVSGVRLNADDPLAGHKTFNYGTHLWAYERRPTGCDDVILSDTGGRAVSASRGNLHLRCGGRWLTPGPPARPLPGIVRGLLLAEGAVAVQPLTSKHLNECDAAAVSNSVRGLVAVTHLNGRPLAVPPDLPGLRAVAGL